MRKSTEAIKGDKLINIRNNKIFTVGEANENTLVLIDENGVAQVNKISGIRRWYKMYQEYVEETPVVVEPEANTVDINIESIIAQLGCTIEKKKEYNLISYQGNKVMRIRNAKGNKYHYEVTKTEYNRLSTTLVGQFTYHSGKRSYRVSNTTDTELLKAIIKQIIG